MGRATLSPFPASYVTLAAALALGVASCGSSNDGGFNPQSTSGPDAATAGDTSTPPMFGEGGGDGSGGPCVNLQCRQVDCAAQGKPATTITGTVVTATPAAYGTPDPVYNAILYVPNAPVQPFAPGVACDKCGTPVSGSPVVDALSDVAGKFTLTNAPSGANIPLVIQIGRWRRQVTIPNVAACQETQVPEELTRLPHNHTEGDIPHIAIATSIFDAEECILLKMGVDVSEFTIPSGGGRIHLYLGTGATLPNIPDMSTLWADSNTFKQYDMVQMPCESVPAGGGGASPLGPPAQNLVDYANAGGRVFVTDLSYPWYEGAPASWPQTVQWVPWGGVTEEPLPSFIDMSFTKGQALAQWLQGLGATTTLGQIDITDTYHVVDAVNPPTTRWLYSKSPDATLQTFSFNTPVGASADQQCGRAVFHNSHVAGEQPTNGDFPMECSQTPLTPQERMMEFMLLDLASCVQNDTTPPQPPPK